MLIKIFISDCSPFVKDNISIAPIKRLSGVEKSTFSLKKYYLTGFLPHTLAVTGNCPSLMLRALFFAFRHFPFALIVFETFHPLRPVFGPYVAGCGPRASDIEYLTPSEGP